MRYNIAICDDEDLFRRQLSEIISMFQEKNKLDINIETFSSGEALLEYMQTNTPDIIYMDIEMPKGISGIETAKQIRSFNTEIIIIIGTAHDKYALEAYNIEAITYIIKPYNYEKIIKHLSKIVNWVDEAKNKKLIQEKSLLVKYEEWQNAVRINVAEITYMKKNIGSNRVDIYTIDKNYFVYETLEELVNNSAIENKCFYRVNRSTIVNLNKVYMIIEKIDHSIFELRARKGILIMENKEEVNLDNNKYNKIYELFIQQKFKS